MWGNSHQAQDLHPISVEFQLACIRSLCLFSGCLEEHRQELDVCSSAPLCPIQIHLCRKPLAYECIWIRKVLSARIGLGKMQLLGSDELWSDVEWFKCPLGPGWLAIPKPWAARFSKDVVCRLESWVGTACDCTCRVGVEGELPPVKTAGTKQSSVTGGCCFCPLE